jgi:Tol biopolymer transport system component
MRAYIICAALVLAAVLAAPALAEWTTPVPVSSVNTSYNDWLPRLSPDGLSLYFTRDTSGNLRIYEAKRATPSGAFTQIQEVIHSSAGNGNAMYPSASADNLRLYYQDEANPWQIKMSQRASVNGAWSAGTVVPGLPSGITNPSISADEQTIVFSALNAGNYDIYMAMRSDKNSAFSNITILSGINSSFTDGGAFLSSDKLSIYFSSDRNGSGQIFEATRNSLNDPFGNVEHLSLFDGGISAVPCISSDGSSLYFARLSSATAGIDIYVSYNIPEPATLLLLGMGGVLLRRFKK